MPFPLEARDLLDQGVIGKVMSSTYGVDTNFTKIDHMHEKILKTKV